MPTKLQKYDKYKPSQLDWLGDIPEGWELRRVKDFTSVISKGTTPTTEGESFTNFGVRFLKAENILEDEKLSFNPEYFISDKTNKLLSRSQLKYKDILIVIAGATIGKAVILNKSFLPANTNQAVCFLRLRKCFQSTSTKLISKQINSIFFQGMIWGSIVQSAQPNIAMNILGNLYLPIPPLQTQTVIAKYLDTHTAKIDQEIELLTAKASKYRQLKQTLISNTVTKGLDKSVRLKPSGVEWIGDIPEWWEVRRLKDISDNIFPGATPSTTNDDFWNCEDLIWLPSGELQNNIIDKHNGNKYISFEGYKNSSTRMIKSNTVLIALTGATCGNIGLLTFEACANQSVVAISNNSKFKSKFLFYSLLSCRDYIKIYQTGGAQAGINTQDVKDLIIPLPPLQIQQQIADYLDEQTGKIDLIITTINSKITKLKEYRKVLINDVVTGRIKIEN
jgi:type I restriction enzyme, S subunit